MFGTLLWIIISAHIPEEWGRLCFHRGPWYLVLFWGNTPLSLVPGLLLGGGDERTPTCPPPGQDQDSGTLFLSPPPPLPPPPKKGPGQGIHPGQNTQWTGYGTGGTSLAVMRENCLGNICLNLIAVPRAGAGTHSTVLFLSFYYSVFRKDLAE